ADIVFSNARYKVETERQVTYTVEFNDGPVDIDWDAAEPLSVSVDHLQDEPRDGASFAPCPAAAGNAKSYTAWQREFQRWVRQNDTVTLYRSKRFRLTSNPGETEGDFRVRLQDAASEQRDLAIAKVRKRYASKMNTLENRLLRAQQAIEVQQQQASQKKLDTAVSFGTAILGAVLGRKRISSTSAGRFGTAARRASSARKEAADVKRAQQTARKVQADIKALSAELEKEIAALDTTFSAQGEPLDAIVVRAKTTDIHVPVFGLAWLPYEKDDSGRLKPAWQ
ncbi:MAG: hypothetical protein R3358_13995, partial [Woeseiaceae bacterium]|nr:hypothetical protein [Woeseiaceae bacterium]